MRKMRQTSCILLTCIKSLLLVVSCSSLVIVDSFRPDSSTHVTATGSRTRRKRSSSSISSSLQASSLKQQSQPQPIDPAGWPMKFPAQEHCSKCGLCETSFVSHVKDACAFLDDGMRKIDDLEPIVHGRSRRQLDDDSIMLGVKNDNGGGGNDTLVDEARFGVMYEPMKLVRGIQMENSQWTGVVTSIALSMLETNQVDAVVCIANGGSSSDDNESSSWSEPQPILARTRDDVLRGRGVKPALAPSLNVLDQIQADPSIRRLLFCGVGCAVQAFRAVQDDLHLDQVYVLGTNCADNSPTPQAARNFIQNGVKININNEDDSTSDNDDTILGYEFMQDYRVHLKTKNNYYKKPYFCLPGSIAKQSIAPSCLACFDYTNSLADVVVGYMAAPLDQRMDQSWQTLTVRNKRGAKMVATATAAGRLDIGPIATGTGNHESIAMATTMSDFMVHSMINDDNENDITRQRQSPAGMPLWMGEIMAFVLRTTGPKGVAFARYSIDYHILRNYLHVLKEWGADVNDDDDDAAVMMTRRLPRYALDIVEHYLSSNPKFQQAQTKIFSSSKHKKKLGTKR